MMMTTDKIRLWNARYLADTLGKDPIARMSDRLAKSQSQVGHLIGLKPVKNIGGIIARQIEKKFKKPEGWLDQSHSDLWAKITNPNWIDQAAQLTQKKTRIEEKNSDYDVLSPDALTIAQDWQRLPPEDQAKVQRYIEAAHEMTHPNNKESNAEKAALADISKDRSPARHQKIID